MKILYGIYKNDSHKLGSDQVAVDGGGGGGGNWKTNTRNNKIAQQTKQRKNSSYNKYVPKINEFRVFSVQIKHNDPGGKRGNILIQPILFHIQVILFKQSV
jgi:hypothetical protein